MGYKFDPRAKETLGIHCFTEPSARVFMIFCFHCDRAMEEKSWERFQVLNADTCLSLIKGRCRGAEKEHHHQTDKPDSRHQLPVLKLSPAQKVLLTDKKSSVQHF